MIGEKEDGGFADVEEEAMAMVKDEGGALLRRNHLRERERRESVGIKVNKKSVYMINSTRY